MSLCPHGYTAFWDCPTCEEPMGTAPSERHEFGCTAYVGRPCICRQLRRERFTLALPHSRHTHPVRGCDLCDSLMDEARQIEHDAPWNEPS